MNLLTMHPRHALIQQKRLSNLLEAKRLINLAARQLVRELEAGAVVEPGKHAAWLQETRRGGMVKRTLKVI